MTVDSQSETIEFLALPPPSAGFRALASRRWRRRSRRGSGRRPAPWCCAATWCASGSSDSIPARALGPAGYTERVNREVYRRIVETAAEALGAGIAVIADTVFARPAEREAIAAAAAGAGAPFAGLWLEAPAEVMAARVRSRVDGPSDADEAVLRRQLSYETGTIAWRCIDAAGPAGTLAGAVEAMLADVPLTHVDDRRAASRRGISSPPG